MYGYFVFTYLLNTYKTVFFTYSTISLAFSSKSFLKILANTLTSISLFSNFLIPFKIALDHSLIILFNPYLVLR